MQAHESKGLGNVKLEERRNVLLGGVWGGEVSIFLNCANVDE